MHAAAGRSHSRAAEWRAAHQFLLNDKDIHQIEIAESPRRYCCPGSTLNAECGYRAEAEYEDGVENGVDKAGGGHQYAGCFGIAAST